MAKFNPDSYLNDFDPDAYISESEPTGDLGNASDAIVEPIKAIAGSAGTEIVAGLGGLAQAINPFAEEGAGAKAVEDIRAAAPDFSPQTQVGQASLETVGQLIEKGIDIVNFPLSGLEGLSLLIKGFTLDDPLGGLDKAVATIKDIQKSGLGQNLGNRALEGTGSPLLATIAELTPDITGIITGAPLAASAGRAAVTATPKALGKAVAVAGDIAGEAKALTGEVVSKGGELAKDVTGRVKQLASDLSNVTNPEKQRIAKLLIEGSDDVGTAGFRLEAGVKRPKQPTRLQEFLDIGGPKIESFPPAQDAIKQGFSKGAIAAVQGASKSDKKSMRQMVDIMGGIRKNAKFGMRNRPSDVTGDLLMQRLNVVRAANRDAGKSIKPIADSLEGTRVDVREMGQSFSDSLDDMGITLLKNEDGKIIPNFLDSDIEGVTGAESVITKVVNRIQRVAGDGKIDALKLHKLKKFIDEQVTFGKNSEGLAGQAEAALKELRRDIRIRLSEVSPKYADANATYSETIDILDRFQEVAGKKMKLTGDNAEKATGTLMRRLMGNAQSRIRLLDSIDEIEKAAFKFGGKGKLLLEGKGGGKSDLLTQVLFASELDEVFGPAARTSLQGEFDAVMKRSARAATSQAGALDVAVDVVAAGVNKARNINEEAAFKAIRDLLKDVN